MILGVVVMSALTPLALSNARGLAPLIALGILGPILRLGSIHPGRA